MQLPFTAIADNPGEDLSKKQAIAILKKSKLTRDTRPSSIKADLVTSICPTSTVSEDCFLSVSNAKNEDLPRVSYLYKQLAKIDTMKALDLADRGLTDADMKVMSKALAQGSNVKKIFINGNKIDDEGMAALASALREGAAPNLKSINLGGNKRFGMTESSCSVLKSSRDGLALY